MTTLIEQHHKVSRLLLRAKAAAKPEERRDLWSDIRREGRTLLVRKFAFRVRDHADKEERVIFPLAEEVLTDSELEKMELDYLTAKARVAIALV